ncbi:MAG: redoxin domain-containing protein [Limisphaerales bacterium]
MHKLLTLLVLVATISAADEFVAAPAHHRKPGVPEGQVIAMPQWNSKVFPGTTRDWWIYVPAQYNDNKPANVMVFQDGHDYVRLNGNWRLPIVFDNLIHSGAMPVTIAILINPGHNGSYQPKSPWRVSNRSFEYDTLSDQYARFLLAEILPEVGKRYKLTEDPEGRAICGASSGGICSFTAAWERPDAFRKVLTTIGSFTNIRGGHSYPNLIRKTERKPLRIFLQDGVNDLDNRHGNWPLGNRRMESALKYMKYDFKSAWGEGEHNSKHAGSIFPAALKWLWRDHEKNRDRRAQLLWQDVKKAQTTFEGLHPPDGASPEQMKDFFERYLTAGENLVNLAQRYARWFPDHDGDEALEIEEEFLELTMYCNSSHRQRLWDLDQARIKASPRNEANIMSEWVFRDSVKGLGEIDLEKLRSNLQSFVRKYPSDSSAVEIRLDVGGLFEAKERLQLLTEAEAVLPKIPKSLAEMYRGRIAQQRKELKWVDQVVPLEFASLDGRRVDRKALAGKVVLIDFWSTGCPPCIAGLPDLREAYERYHRRGFEIIGISKDDNEKHLRRFLKTAKLPWPQYFNADLKSAEHLANKFGIVGIPVLWLLDRQGQLRYVNGREDTNQKLEVLLAESAD